MTANHKEKLIEVNKCTKSFSGVTVLKEVCFDLYPGEIHCICGENGAGKSTLIKILSGMYAPDSGEVSVCGKAIKHFHPDVLKNMGVETIYQNQFLMPDMTVAENIFIGNYGHDGSPFMDYKALFSKADKLLKEISVDIDPGMPAGELSLTGKQMVQIARALSHNVKVLIMDEPTASFCKEETEMLIELLKRISRKGIGIIYISHRLEEVFMLADTVTVLRDGIRVSCCSRDELTEKKLILDMVGRSAELFYKREDVKKGDERLTVSHLYKNGYLQETSFSMLRGEILGFGGITGSGRTELANLIFGIKKADGGTVRIGSRDITSDSPYKAIKNGICLITEDRHSTGLFLDHSVGWNFVSAAINKRSGVLLNQSRENQKFERYIRNIAIKTQGADQEVRFLSGGNQQKVILAKWMYANADVVIFDEPTKGIDIGAKEDVYKLMVELAKKGKFIIMISSDIPELAAMSDRIAVMRGRKIAGILDRYEISEERILSLSVGELSYAQ